jgi:iron complex outermembrane receptor protein
MRVRSAPVSRFSTLVGRLGLTALLALVPATTAAQAPEYRLGTLRVSVSSRLLPGLGTRAMEVVTSETLQALPVRSITEALVWAAGVEVEARSPAQADVSIRGSSFEQVVVLVNGVRMSDPQTGHFDLDLAVPLERVERIEVLRGPASSLFGADAVGGVVNVVTRDGDETEVRGRVEGSSNAGRHASLAAGGTLGGVRFAGGADWARSDGHREGTDFDILRFHGQGSTSVAGGTLALEGGWAQRDFGADGFYAPFPSYEETATKTIAASWTGSAGGLALRPSVWRRDHDDDFVLRRSDPSFYRNLHTSIQTGMDLVARASVGGRALLAVGGEWVRESLESTSLGNRREGRRAVFAEGTALLEGTTLRGGLRLDRYETFGSVVTPSVSASTLLGTRVRARVAAGRAFRAPTWTERYYTDPANQGRPDLDPERSWTLEAGLDVTLRHEVALSATGFTRRTEGLIDWARAAGVDTRWETRNVESADFHGLELALHGILLGPARIDLTGSALRLTSREAEGLESKYALRPTTRRGSMRLNLPLGGSSAGAVQVLHAGRAGEDTHTTVDVRLTRRVAEGELYLDLRNLLDEAYLDVTRMPAPGRSISMGVRFGLGGG